MTRVSFDSTKKPLEELLKQAHAGQLQLPDFQRSWVWKDDGLRALLASVSRSFPVGTLMTLQTGGEVFKPRLKAHPPPARQWSRTPWFSTANNGSHHSISSPCGRTWSLHAM